MGKPVVFVIGASGNIGAATVAALSAKYADQVEIRAGVRNPDKADKLKSLANVTIVQASMGDKENLTAVLKGVDVLYIVTPTSENRAQLAIATAEAAKTAGVKHLGVVSVTTAGLPNVLYGRQFGEIESTIGQLSVPYTFVRLPYFAENLWASKATIAGQGTIITPADPTKPFGLVTAEDAGEAGAAILVNPAKHAGKTYDLISDVVTYNDIVSSFSKALGKKIKYTRVPYEAAKQGFVGAGFPEWQVDGFFEVLKLIDNDVAEANPISDLSAYETLTGRKPTTADEWITKNAPGFL